MIFATVPVLRAMRCQMEELKGLSLQAEYDNDDFYRTAIRKMQHEIEALNARAITAATAVRSPNAGTIFLGETTAELIANAKGWFQNKFPTRQLRGVDALLIEFCAPAKFELIKNVRYGSVARRVTDKEDFTRGSTIKAVE